MGNRNDLGLLLLLPFAVLLGSRCEGQVQRIARRVGILIVLAGITLTTTLTAIVAVLPMSVAAIVMGKALRSRQVIWSILVVSAVAIGSMQLSFVQERLEPHKVALLSGDWAGALGNRYVPFSVSMTMVLEQPLTGIGPGRFSWEYIDAVVASGLSIEGVVGTRLWQTVHNDYLEVAAETGVPPLLGCFALACILLVGFYKNGSDAAVIGACILVGLGTAALMLYPFQLGGVYGTMAIQLGVCWGLACRR